MSSEHTREPIQESLFPDDRVAVLDFPLQEKLNQARLTITENTTRPGKKGKMRRLSEAPPYDDVCALADAAMGHFERPQEYLCLNGHDPNDVLSHGRVWLAMRERGAVLNLANHHMVSDYSLVRYHAMQLAQLVDEELFKELARTGTGHPLYDAALCA